MLMLPAEVTRLPSLIPARSASCRKRAATNHTPSVSLIRRLCNGKSAGFAGPVRGVAGVQADVATAFFRDHPTLPAAGGQTSGPKQPVGPHYSLSLSGMLLLRSNSVRTQ